MIAEAVDPAIYSSNGDDEDIVNRDADIAAAVITCSPSCTDPTFSIDGLLDVCFCRASGCHMILVRWTNYGPECDLLMLLTAVLILAAPLSQSKTRSIC